MQKIQKYLKYNAKINKLSYMANILYYDASTDCPTLAKEYSFSLQEELVNKVIKLKKSTSFNALINELVIAPSLDDLTLKAVKKEKKELDKLQKLDEKRVLQHNKDVNEAYMAFEKAHATDNYEALEAAITKVLDYFYYYTETLRNDSESAYDVMLKEFEESFNEELYDELFLAIEKEIVPLVKRILALPKKMIELPNRYDLDKQRKLTDILREILGYRNDCGTVRETLHPYTIHMTRNDVRITTKYLENDMFSNLYSVMHEVGHALYQLGIDNKFENTSLNSSPSMAFDESQSRFLENYIGRNWYFIQYLKPQLDLLFPELKDYSVEEIYQYVNRVEAGLIRIEADELTYPIHVLIRYKIEKMLFNKELTINQVGAKFADLMEEYLGVRPQNKGEGAFQDVHWTSDFGYFPTYVLGSAIGAQLLNTIKQELDFDGLLSQGKVEEIIAWLRNNIHVHGAYYNTNELLELVTKEKFNVRYYIEYLKSKFMKLYEVNYED